MLEGSLSRVRCPRCGLDIRLRTAALDLDRCPRCYAHEGVVVPIASDAEGSLSPRLGHLTVTTERRGETVVLALHGNLDLGSESCLMHALGRARVLGSRRLVIDLSSLEFIDWIGLQLLLRARQQTLDRGHEFSLLRGSPTVQRLFELTGAADVFSFDD